MAHNSFLTRVGLEGIILDFSGVEVLTPSFADEFVKGLKEIYSDKKITFELKFRLPPLRKSRTIVERDGWGE